MSTSSNTPFEIDVNHNEEFKLNPLTYQHGSLLCVLQIDFEDMVSYLKWKIPRQFTTLYYMLPPNYALLDLSTMLIPNNGSLAESQQELMHNYHLDRRVPRCAFKVDIQKAYDTVDWNFLQRILICFGFQKRMVTWIMECVTTTSFSISINGSLHGYFKGKRGLLQGDPLYPYLFTMVMEILTLMLKRRVHDSDLFTYHRYCSKMELINSCFADDLFLFAHGDPNSASVIMEALDEFKFASGLVPSLPKSTSYFCNVLNHIKIAILQILPFEEGSLSLSRSKVSWEVVCLPKAERDLGIKRLGVFNNALILSPLASIISSRDIYRACLTSNSKVGDLLLEGTLVWPPDLFARYPMLLSFTSPSLVGPCDQQEWHNRSGNIVPFLVNEVWNSIRPMAAKVDWFRVICFTNCIPRHAINFWLIIKKSDILPFANRRTTRSVISKLVVAATAYFIWQERNYRLFKKVKRSENQLVECIISSVRFKLMTCRFKKLRDGQAILRQWKLSEMVLC
nr:putative RNA-directed DNA polymerase, eukaryota, reverse transcriptase zinc-binding domain protein [Tanacetum cinerariifolium]